MKAEEVRRIREKLGMSREDFAELICLSTSNSVTNIEIGFRNAGKLTAKLLRYVDSLPKAKAQAFIEEINRHEP